MTITAADEAPMAQAIEASREALAEGDMPFGATLVSRAGELLWVARNRESSSGDCTAHAELALVREASAEFGADALRGATVYASGEPCAMCAGALFWAGVTRVVFAVSQSEIAAVLGGPTLPINTAHVLAGASPAVVVEGPLLGAQALAVLREAAAMRP